MPTIVGFDQSRRAMNSALLHIDNAGLANKIHVECRDISNATPADSWQQGIIVCNPPYGERLGTTEEMEILYRQFGDTLKAEFTGWQAALIISDPELGFRLGIRSQNPLLYLMVLWNVNCYASILKAKTFLSPKQKTNKNVLSKPSIPLPNLTQVQKCLPTACKK